MTVDSDLKHHQDTWNGFVKGTVYGSAFCIAVLALLGIFVA